MENRWREYIIVRTEIFVVRNRIYESVSELIQQNKINTRTERESLGLKDSKLKYLFL